MAFKLRTRTQFPANVSVTSPLTVQKTGLMYLFGLSITALRTTLDAIYAPISAASTDPTYYAADYGVLGDGGTYTTQMQALLNAVLAAGGGKIVLPRGSFSCGALTYSTPSGAPFRQGIQIAGQGMFATTIVFTGTSSFLFTQDSTTAFQAGIEFRNFRITAAQPGSGAISLHMAAYAKIENMQISVQGSGISNTAAGDPDSTFQVHVKSCRFDNCAQTVNSFAINVFPSGTAVEISNWRIEDCQFEACGISGAVVTPPTSGAIRWRGLLCEVINCGFTTNNNTAIYVAKSGGAQGLTIKHTDFENTNSTVLPHIYCDTGLRLLEIGEGCQFLNNDTFKCQGGIWFDSTAGVQGNITIDGATFRTSTGNNPYVAFKQLGTVGNWMAETIRVRNINWQTFDGTGQTRFSGAWLFDPVPGQCRATISALNTITLVPTGAGATMPMKLAATGEIVPFVVPNAGVVNAAIGGLSANTTYNFYFKNNSATSAPIGGRIDVSGNAATRDINGYDLNSGDSTGILVARFTTDASGNFQTTSAGYSVYPLTGDDPGVGWLSYTPTVTSQGGAITTSSATGKIKRLGARTWAVTVSVTVTTAGTGTGYLIASLPTGVVAASGGSWLGSAQESNVSGKAGSAQVLASASTIKSVDSAGVTFIANGAIVTMACVFEATI